MKEQIMQTMQEHGMLADVECLLLAVSGGADSVALACLLHEIGDALSTPMGIAHVNHNLRGAESDADEAFVKELAGQLGVPFQAVSVDLDEINCRGESLEMAARRARYQALQELTSKREKTTVATGHTWDDQVETVLMRVCTGTGGVGLRGIRYVRDSFHGNPRVVRPLLDVKREQVERYLQARGQTWREDGSNADPSFLRNRIRHEVLPFLETVVPSVRDNLMRMARITAEESVCISRLAGQILREAASHQNQPELQCSDLMTHPLALRRQIVRMWLASRMGGEPRATLQQVEQVLQLAACADGTLEVQFPGGWNVVRRYDELDVVKPGVSTCVVERALQLPGETILDEVNLVVSVAEQEGKLQVTSGDVGTYPIIACVRRDRAELPGLQVRAWRPGDRIQPTGMHGSRKLQDVFGDLKVPKDQRGRIPLIVSGEDIVWVPGYRVDRRWAVPDEHETCYRLEIRERG